LCKDIITGYSALEEESQQRNLAAWRPVVVDVLEGFATFPPEAFTNYIPDFYPLAVDLLTKDLSADLRGALLVVLRRVGEVALGIDGLSSKGLSAGGDVKERRESFVSNIGDGDAEAAARRML
jgi:brefeldin A-inhibited guanine nucleotide-exchange protein